MLSSAIALFPFQSIRTRLLFGAACLLIAVMAVAGTDEKKAPAPVRVQAAASIPQVVVTAKRMTDEQKKQFDEKIRQHEAAEYGPK